MRAARDKTRAEPSGDSGARLAEDAIGFREALAVGLASTAPAYSLAAVIGTVTVIVGVQAPTPRRGRRPRSWSSPSRTSSS